MLGNQKKVKNSEEDYSKKMKYLIENLSMLSYSLNLESNLPDDQILVKTRQLDIPKNFSKEKIQEISTKINVILSDFDKHREKEKEIEKRSLSKIAETKLLFFRKLKRVRFAKFNKKYLDDPIVKKCIDLAENYKGVKKKLTENLDNASFLEYSRKLHNVDPTVTDLYTDLTALISKFDKK